MFTFGERLGIFFTVEAACLSIACVSFILCFAVYKWLRRTVLIWRKTSLRSPDASDSSLFLNLMVADLIQAIGIMPNVRWMTQAGITEGHLCTAQAVVKQVGIVGVSVTSLAIALHTFSVLVLRWRAPRHATRIMIVGVWMFAALVIGIPNAVHRHQRYYGEIGYWCWIIEEFRTEQIVSEYLWVWVAGFSMVILYTIMFIVMRGWFVIDNGVHWHKNYNPSCPSVAEIETDEEKQTKVIATLMLFYPALYIFCVFPNSLSRWLTFRGFNTPYQFTLFANSLYGLSGMLNVILFFITRPELVVGPSVVIVEDEELSFHHRKEPSGRSGHKFGHLPERDNNDLQLDEVKWPQNSQQTVDARMLPDHATRTSPLRLNASLPSSGNFAVTSSYLPAERDTYTRLSRESPSLIEEEEDYGRLPG
ncbi:hypothetical protein BDZ97DRAFT_1914223 [Flammula alnicola]|nr:hypothetical protein BDZ97DRAFT_1914223 [Flammula alnicola]